MLQKLRSLPEQFQKINSEQEQALLRVIFSLIIFIYLTSIFDTGANSPDQKTVLIFSGGFLIFSALLAAAIFRVQETSSTRQSLAMIADLGAVTFGMLFTKETGTLFYGIYLWVIVGNGIRYGTRSLVRSQILGLLGFSAVIMLNDYWSAHTTLAIGLLLTCMECLP